MREPSVRGVHSAHRQHSTRCSCRRAAAVPPGRACGRLAMLLRQRRHTTLPSRPPSPIAPPSALPCSRRQRRQRRRRHGWMQPRPRPRAQRRRCLLICLRDMCLRQWRQPGASPAAAHVTAFAASRAAFAHNCAALSCRHLRARGQPAALLHAPLQTDKKLRGNQALPQVRVVAAERLLQARPQLGWVGTHPAPCRAGCCAEPGAGCFARSACLRCPVAHPPACLPLPRPPARRQAAICDCHPAAQRDWLAAHWPRADQRH